MGYQNWKESKQVYEMLRIIYEAKKISLKTLSQGLNKKYNTISEQTKPLIESKLIQYQKEGRETIYTINDDAILKFFKMKKGNQKIMLELMRNASNINELSFLVEDKEKNFYMERESFQIGLSKENIAARVKKELLNFSYDSFISNLINENAQLKKELKELKKEKKVLKK